MALLKVYHGARDMGDEGVVVVQVVSPVAMGPSSTYLKNET